MGLYKELLDGPYTSLYDRGCRYPECTCKVPAYAVSQHNREKFCLRLKDVNEKDK